MSEEQNQLNEPTETYGQLSSVKKKITFFNSFEEAEEHGLRQMASHSFEQRLENLEIVRKRSRGQQLLPDGSIPPLRKVITIDYASYL